VRRPLLFRAGDVWWPRVHEAGAILGCRRQARPRLEGRRTGNADNARGGGTVQAEKALFDEESGGSRVSGQSRCWRGSQRQRRRDVSVRSLPRSV
jgi:hypothetical protein